MPGEDSLSPSDVELLRRTAAGDHGAFTVFVDRHQGAVYRFLSARTGSAADSEDALQETFVAAFRGCGSYRGEASGRSWLFGIARNLSKRMYRKRVGEPDEMVPLEELGLQAGWGCPPWTDSFLERLERRDTLEKALGHLSPDEREILILRELEGLSGEETAEVLELSLPAMKSRLHRARLRLAAVLVGGTHG
ncbi:MAG: RNA polymerase sigma factor [Gemmatimonadetes bacterium]|nr:RNA polymerase sigma factor [Gemmatimonadota bacterium]NNM04970.1 RNA polymerase sigma factor [Gemmatimonadota bacterium]